jgi:RHS repeat-associated protein
MLPPWPGADPVCEVPVRRSRVLRLWSGIAVVPVVALAAAMVPAAASAAPARPARPAAGAARAVAAGEARPGRVARDAGADGPAAVPVPAGTVASPPSIPVGTGPVKNGTFLSFSVSDRVSLQVNVGSGDALVTTSDIAVPEIGSTLTLGTSYNSLLTGSGVPQGAEGYGWRQREGVDVQLYPATSDGSVTLLGENGTAGNFTAPASGNVYGSPAEFQATLTNAPGSTCSGSAYQLTWHQTGEVMCFTTAGLLTSEADRDGNVTAYAYNGSGQETSITYTPRGASSATRTVTASYTGSYLTGLSQSGGSLGTRTITYTVNASTGNLTSVKQADGTTVSFGYDSSHDLTSIENGADLTTQIGYNSSHQVTSVTQQTTGTATAVTRLDYVSSTETQVAEPDTSQTQTVPSVPNITYTIAPASSLVTRAVDQSGAIRKATYNGYDDVATSTNASSGETVNSYGGGSASPESLSKTQSPTGATASLAYDNSDTDANPTAQFQPSGSTDAQGDATAYSYDSAGDLQQVTDATPAISQVSLNADGTPATSTNPRSAVTTYSYTDGDHELNKITPPTTGSLKPETITYDGFGRVSTITDGDGNVLTYTYDLSDQVTKEAWTGGPHPVTVSYAYDGAGNLHTETDPNGSVTYGYDGRNLETSRAATTGGGTLSYVYDASGNMVTATDGGGTTTYVYSSRNLLDTMTDPEDNTWQFAYNGDGQRTKMWFGTPASGGEATWAAKMVTTYDAADQISEIAGTADSASPSTVYDTSWCYTKAQPCTPTTADPDTSLVQYATSNVSGKVSVFTYDGGNRLTKATNASGSTTDTYGYDADGNLTTGAGVGALAYNTSNQITTSGYTYDGAGNLTADPATGAISYNDAGQTTATATSSNGQGESFTYAGAGQDQVLSDGTADAITYGLSGQDGQPWIQSYTPFSNDSPTGSAKPVYILHDQQGAPLGYTENGKAYAFITDNLGSVVAIVASTGSTTATYSYDPDGQGGGNQIGYTGALANPDLDQDPSSGSAGTNWVHDGNRWYNPATGTFTTTDPVTQLDNPAQGNAYPYAADNPENYEDPTGQDLWDDVAGAVAGLTAGVIAFDASGGDPFIAAAVGGCVGAATGELVSGSTAAVAAGACVAGGGLGAFGAFVMS